ncbi:MFS transporter [Paenibacillus mendelii]|uniref:MFS transporter n=1 Tax=Paenibacillus mendelii TaxID=206163 RepID=A0ABV6JAH0_9BACL|nr:MFS transporter [Paenibacillus mendelii]MCQ6560718.1 MFS transporter [Paenibacillus mendelii]
MTSTTTGSTKVSIFDAPYRALTIGIILAVTTVAFEGLAITTIAPKLAQQLNGLQLYGWIFTAFMLSQIIGTMVMGKQVDKRGVFKPFVWAIGLFVVGIVIAALSYNMLMLIAGRAFQGFGAGSIITCVYYSITLSYPDALRTKILAAFSSAYILPALIGPYFAGVLAEFVSWRFVFWFVLPLIALAVFLTLPTFRNIKAIKHAPDQKGTHTEIYAVLIAIGTGLLLTGLGMITDWKGIILAIVGAVVMIQPLRKLLPEGSFRVKRGLAATILTRGLYFACYIAAESYVVLAFTELKGYSSDIAGLIIAGGSLAWSFAAWLQSKLDEKDGGSGREKRVIVGIGIMIVGIAMVITTIGWPGGGIALAVMSQILAGFGMGLSNPTTGAIALQHASSGKEGEVSSNIQFIDAFGPGLSIGIGGALIAISESLEMGIYTGIMLAISIQLVFLLLSFAAAFRIKTKGS